VLQDVGGQGDSFATAMNASGQSVGNSSTATGSDAVLWSPSGKATVLQDVGGQGDSSALAINASGGRALDFPLPRPAPTRRCGRRRGPGRTLAPCSGLPGAISQPWG
jgi:hypothetical protein